MRVLMSAGLYDLCGASIVIENLVNCLGKKGIDVTIGAFNFRRIPPSGAYNVSVIPMNNVFKLKKFIDEFDIVHNHHPITNYLALLSNKPFIYHYHGAPDFGRGYLYRFSMLSSIKITSHRFDAVIAVSESGRDKLKQYFNLNKIHVIYNGVDTDVFKPGLEEKKRKGTPQFLFVGNLYAHKKAEELIFALEKLVKRYPRAHLQIVGVGYTYGKLVNLVRMLGLQEHVSLVGFVPRGELPYYYSSCDAYVTASRYELCPLPLLEGWACGKPVVASSIRSHKELLSASKAGKIYKVGDVQDLCATISAVYEHKDEFKRNALQFAKEHDWSVVADRITRIYEQIRYN